jgi:hypothetical protein
MKRIWMYVWARVLIAAVAAGAGCLGSYKAPGTGSSNGSSKPPASSSGGSSSGSGSSSMGSGSSSSGGDTHSTPDMGSPPAPPDMAAPPQQPAPSATPSCDLLIDCCNQNLTGTDAQQCADQFTNLSEDVCADILAQAQAQGACL